MTYLCCMEADKLKYVVLRNRSSAGLTATVNEYIENGWKAIGSHQVVTKSMQNVYAGSQHKHSSYENEYSQTVKRD